MTDEKNKQRKKFETCTQGDKIKKILPIRIAKHY